MSRLKQQILNTVTRYTHLSIKNNNNPALEHKTLPIFAGCIFWVVKCMGFHVYFWFWIKVWLQSSHMVRFELYEGTIMLFLMLRFQFLLLRWINVGIWIVYQPCLFGSSMTLFVNLLIDSCSNQCVHCVLPKGNWIGRTPDHPWLSWGQTR